MTAYEEQTTWDVGYRQPNHQYLLDGDKMLAYRVYGQGPAIFFKKPIRFDRRGRKLIAIDAKVFGAVEPVESNIIKISGSKGNVYEVDTQRGTCTCPGFTFRGNCKHINQAA